MLTPREYDQIQIALFGMTQTKMNGILMVNSEHVLALLKSYTEGEFIIERTDNGGLTTSLITKEETTK
jgi:hypothetical protein